HLGERCRRQRFTLEATEARKRLVAEGLAQAAFDFRERARWHLVLQRLQCFAEGAGQERADDAQHLAHLDEHSAQARKALRQPARVAEMSAREASPRSLLAEGERKQPLP